jgi:hypothetical protein
MSMPPSKTFRHRRRMKEQDHCSIELRGSKMLHLLTAESGTKRTLIGMVGNVGFQEQSRHSLSWCRLDFQ